MVDIETIDHLEKPESIAGPPPVLTMENDSSMIINDKEITIVENFVV